jgi:hypothetical protein
MSSTGITSPRLPLEPKGADFPYYADNPPTISNAGWLRAAAFVGLPLLALAIATPGRWGAIFRRVGLRDVLLMFGFAILNIIVSMSVGALLQTFGTVTTNAGVAGAAGLEGARLASYFAKVGLQLLGEELITILPFLALLWYLHARAGLSRNVECWLRGCCQRSLSGCSTCRPMTGMSCGAWW